MLWIQKAINGWVIDYGNHPDRIQIVHSNLEDAIECVSNLMQGKVAEPQPSS